MRHRVEPVLTGRFDLWLVLPVPQRVAVGGHVELSPKFAEAWHNLGMVALELGQRDPARAAIERAVALTGQFAGDAAGLATVPS